MEARIRLTVEACRSVCRPISRSGGFLAASHNWLIRRCTSLYVCKATASGAFGGGADRNSAVFFHSFLTYYSADAGGSTYSTAGPARLLDSRAAVGRPGTTPVPARGEVSLQVAGRGGVPQSGVKAVVLNMTVTDAKDGGHLTVWPSGSERPNSSSLNWTAGQTVPNHVVVPVGADGTVKLFNASWGTAHLIADVFGYYSDDQAGATFHTAGPKRMLDTRTTGVVPARGSTLLDLSGSGELGRAKAVVLNVTVTDPKSDGHLTAWPSGTTRPDSSNLNWTTGTTVANLVTVPVGSDGKVEIANLGWGSAHVIVDLFGYFA
ncbi:hypothetical protein OHB39_36285 [Streptomyces sp. NBC_00047]|uniref:hypothetical protein n=1 Tax=Streptomyces sp. NBC_00047 TaxID=2975627 RepID=UPI00225848D5|nr:hypothetical protein [Streptomyces sp. NBC_00047]MCX5612972.1 hypothetical protein [Streptomyces sp. NBC_00047]